MNLSDTDQAPYSAPAPQTATVSDEAVQAAITELSKNIPAVIWMASGMANSDAAMRAALIAALPHLALSAAPCAVEVGGLIWKDLDNGGSKCETDSKYSIDFWPREKLYVDAYTKMMRRNSLSEAKSAMQGQFERFFKPYIVTKPVDVATSKEERHANTARNLIINRTSTDLENIINGHDPEHSILNNDVWDRLDKMACEIEALPKPVDVAAVRDASFRQGLLVAANSCDRWADDLAGLVDSVEHHLRSKATAIRALSPAEPVDQWQDIATAPKDGTWIIAVRPECTFGRWDRVVIVCWSDEYKKWVWADSQFDVYKDDINETDDDGRYKYDPYQSLDFTHWMPLPAAPTSKGGG